MAYIYDKKIQDKITTARIEKSIKGMTLAELIIARDTCDDDFTSYREHYRNKVMPEGVLARYNCTFRYINAYNARIIQLTLATSEVENYQKSEDE